MLIPQGARALKFAAAVALALGATACAKNAADDASIAGAAGGGYGRGGGEFQRAGAIDRKHSGTPRTRFRRNRIQS